MNNRNFHLALTYLLGPKSNTLEGVKESGKSRLWVITLAKDNPTELYLTLRSIALQSEKPHGVLVVDGSRPVNQIEILEVSEKLGASYIWTKPRGIYDAMNRGLDNVPSDCFVLFLNSGDWLCSPKSVKYVREAIDRHPEVDWCVGDLIAINGTNVSRSARHRIAPQSRKRLRLNDFWFPHPSTAVRASALDENGRFVLNFAIAADYLMSLKLWESSGPPLLVDIPISAHYLNGLSASSPITSTLERSRARILVFGPPQFFAEAIIVLMRLLLLLKPIRKLIKGDRGSPRPSNYQRSAAEAHFCSWAEPRSWPACCIELLQGETVA